MIINNTKTTSKPSTYADVNVGDLFSLTKERNEIFMKTSEYGKAGSIIVNSVNIKTGILYSFNLNDKIIPIKNYELNIFD